MLIDSKSDPVLNEKIRNYVENLEKRFDKLFALENSGEEPALVLKNERLPPTYLKVEEFWNLTSNMNFDAGQPIVKLYALQNVEFRIKYLFCIYFFRPYFYDHNSHT